MNCEVKKIEIENLYYIETYKNEILIKDVKFLLEIIEKNNVNLDKKEKELIEILKDITKL